MTIRVQEEDFDIDEEMKRLRSGRTDLGALVSFTGIVRDGDQTDPISAMTLEHYPGMTERELENIAEEASSRWPLQDCLIVHRYGRLVPGENIVLVITASAHRQASFDAANFLMDYLKTNAPFWKFEEKGGSASWVDEKQSDRRAKERWTSDP